MNMIDSIKIPENFDFRINKKVKDTYKNMLKIKDDKTFIELRKILLEYLNKNKLIENNMIKIKTLNITNNDEETILFSDLDKIVYKLFE
jgi:hypothetical protein